MNHQGVSQILFEESYTVLADQTARSLFARLPHDCEYAQKMIECLATGYLVAALESICICEMQHQIDPLVEVVLGRTIRIERRAPILSGLPLQLSGWAQTLSERSVTFCVQAFDDHEMVCEAAVTLVVVRRASTEMRIASKVNAL